MKRKINSLFYILLTVTLISCVDAGTLEQIDKGNNSNIEVFKYYYSDGGFVYVSRFKNTPEVITTTWQEQQGKSSQTRGNVTVFENDSIKVILK